MPTSNTAIYGEVRALGATVEGFKEDVQALRAAVERMEKRAEERDDVARVSRARLYAEIRTVKDQLKDVERTATKAEAAATKALEVTDRVEQWEQQGKGALLVLGVGGVSVGAVFWWFMDAFIQWLRARMGL